MKTVSILELHEKTGDWVRRSAKLGAITITDRGKPIARIESVQAAAAVNPFAVRKLRPGYARLLGKLDGGIDSTEAITADRDRSELF